jgi:hypothetical protein
MMGICISPIFSQVVNKVDFGFYWANSNNQFTDAVSATGTPNAVSTAFYDPTKPTVFYFHGWQKDTSTRNYARENFLYTDPTTKVTVDTIAKWKSDGWNVGIFYWNQFADEAEVKDAEAKIWSISGPKGIRYRLSDGTYSSTYSPKVSIGQAAYDEYLKLMANYTGSEVRFAGHSLGSQLITNVAMQVSNYVVTNPSKANIMPKRLELLDAFFSKDAKTYLGDRVGSTYSSCSKGDGRSDWNGEVVRCFIYNMINRNGIAVTWYKTSAIFDASVGDSNQPLQTIVALQNVASFWLTATDQTSKHVWARYIYFWSKSVSEFSGFPREFTADTSGNRTYTNQIVSYANTPITRIKSMMGATYYWDHVDGKNTPNPQDDTYQRKNR